MPRIAIYRPDDNEGLPANSIYTVQGVVRPNNATVTVLVHVFNPGPPPMPPTFSQTTYTVTASGGQWQLAVSIGAAGLTYTFNASANGELDVLFARSV